MEDSNTNSESKSNHPLIQHSKAGNLQAVRQLIESGVDPNLRHTNLSTAVMYAAENGHQDLVDYLLAHKANPFLRSGCGINLLYYACRKGLTKTVKCLFTRLYSQTQLRAALVEHYIHGDTLLHVAAHSGVVKCVKVLIAKMKLYHLSFNGRNGSDCTPFIVAINNHKLKIAQMLYNAGVDPIIPNRYKATPLHVSVNTRYVEGLEWLLTIDRVRANTNAKDIHGYTPLIHATVNNNPVIVRLLLEAGADPMICTSNGANVFHMAAVKGHLECMKLLSANISDRPDYHHWVVVALIEAINNNRQEIVQFLVQIGADLNFAPPTVMMSPLLFATWNERVECVKMLIEAKVNLNITDTRNGYTSLDYAVNKNNIQIVSLLLDAGADPEGTSNSLESAVYKWNPEIVRLLLDAIGKRQFKTRHFDLIDTIDSSDQDSSHEYSQYLRYLKFYEFAEACKDPEIAGLLKYQAIHHFDPNGRSVTINMVRDTLRKYHVMLSIDRRLVNHRDGYGMTALHYAVMRNECASIKQLLLHGANPFIRNNRGVSVLDLVSNSNLQNIFQSWLRLEVAVKRYSIPADLIPLIDQYFRVF